MAGRPHEELYALRDCLRSINNGLDSYEPDSQHLPIIDSSGEATGEGMVQTREVLPGLRFLREEVKRDLQVLEKFLDDPESASLPPLSTNAPYLIAVWQELLQARGAVAIYRMFYLAAQPQTSRSKSKNASTVKGSGVKVDVVADNGRHWIRVNTIKNSRILMEFREMDSYLTSSDEDDNDGDSLQKGESLILQEFDISVLRMGRELLAAAVANPLHGSKEIPLVTIRLTRLDPSVCNTDHGNGDPRIAYTIDCLRRMGIDVQLGDRQGMTKEAIDTPALPIAFAPTTDINLDLSALIALISDITHSDLPRDPEQANARFIPPQRYVEWKKQRIHSLSDSTNGASTWEDSGTHSRALADQAQQEMKKGLLQDMHDRLRSVSPTLQDIQFWTTHEARQRCLQIVSKIGGMRERRRADALLSSSTCSQAATILTYSQYWAYSRYPANFIPLMPIRLFPSTKPDDTSLQSFQRNPPSSFLTSLASTCQSILSQEDISKLHESQSLPGHSATPYRSNDEGDIPPAAITAANPKLTAHTVQSMLWGAVVGWTTLTTNRSSVKALIKEMKRFTGGGALTYEPLGGDESRASIWIVNPRSLAEGMRSDGSGD
ncbi:hypothetical protein K503DRAFT_772025 [Rhizopogon vinicolor AM-OR11-026]|uniref:DUF1308 domain-containing protein n=1 Tax=Rhizopogon vinicolor AM-OR11-026 TaxID=1314800 RepID=A0A1B7MWA8_9AGAM|nr:hypothetical protein K503DRAFT_772025 [Rhizopogon vinicolor AM-OR11-026]